MRSFLLASCFAFVLACGTSPNPGPGDGGSDGGWDAGSGAGIVEARATSDGVGLNLPLSGVVVTSVSPALGSDVAGFTVQAAQTGPGLFIAVDPSSLTPAPQPGDTVSFTVTQMGTLLAQRRALALTGYRRSSTGADLSTLTQDVTSVTDLVTAAENYDAELVTISGTLTGTPATSGPSFSSYGLNTTGVPSDSDLRLRAPTSVLDALDAVATCSITATRVPLFRALVQSQVTAYQTSVMSLTGCPAPEVVSAVPLSATSVLVTFSRNILPSSVSANASQFAADNGLSFSAASVSGRTVTWSLPRPGLRDAGIVPPEVT